MLLRRECFTLLRLQAALLLSCVSAFAQTNQSFVTSITARNARSDYSGFVGMEFTVGAAPLTVTALGRNNILGASSGTHTVKLVNAATGLDVPGGAVQVTLVVSSNHVDVFNYANLPAAVQLQANTAYYLLSQEVVNGDRWYDIAPVQTTSAAVVNGGVYTDASGAPVFVPNNAGESYVPVTFLYGNANPVYPPPTVSVLSSSGPTLFIAQASAAIGSIASVQFQLDGQNYGVPVTALNSSSPGYYTLTVTSNSLVDGHSYSLTALATDTFGDSATSPVPVVFTPTGSDQPLLTGQTLGPLRNNYGDQYGHFVGMEFTPSEVLQVYQLGRYVAPGNSRTHLLKLVNATTGADVAGGSITVSLAGTTPGQYVYGNLASPVLLNANTPYYLVSQETTGGDRWYDSAPVTAASFDSIKGSVYQDDGGVLNLAPNTANTSYVPVNLGAVGISGPYTISVTVTSITPAPINTVYSGLLTVQATVSPASALPITTVQLQVDGHVFGSPATSSATGYQAFLDTTQLSNGSHALSVIATDAPGDTGSSASQTLTVSNATTTQTTQPFVTSFTPTFLRNNYSGFVGTQFAVGSAPLGVAWLGRYCVAGNSGAHTVKLVNSPAGTDLTGGSVSIAMSGCKAGQFVYAPLAHPLVLAAGSSYYLASLETSGGDQWYDYGPVSTAEGATVTGAVYFNGAQWVTVPPAGSSYVPINFLISTGTTASPLTVTTAIIGNVVTAAASSGGKILGVQFQIDGLNIYAEVTAPPFTLTVPSLNFGTHKITAVAFDSLGNTATSSPIEDDSVCSQCSGPPNPTFIQAVMTFAGTTLRNNYTGWVGFQFTTTPTGGVLGVSYPASVVLLPCVAGNSQGHVAKLVTAATGLDVPGGAMWLNNSACSAPFTNEIAVPLPQVLAVSTSYYLVIQETAGGDQWYDISPAAAAPFNQFPTYTTIPAPFRIDGPVYFNGFSYVSVPLPNYSYVGLLFAGFSDEV